jgi:hypothetical protein
MISKTNCDTSTYNREPLGGHCMGFDLKNAAPGGICPSFAEIVLADPILMTVVSVWTDVIVPAIKSSRNGDPKIELPSSKEVLGRFHFSLSERIQSVINDNQDAAICLDMIRKREKPFDDLPDQMRALYAPADETIRHYADGLHHHNIDILFAFASSLRAASEALQFEPSTTLREKGERMVKITELLRQIEGHPEMIPEIIFEDLCRRIKNFRRKLVDALAAGLAEDGLQDEFRLRRSLWLELAEQVEGNARRRLGRLDRIQSELQARVDGETDCLTTVNAVQTILLEGSSSGEILDQLRRCLKAQSAEDLSEKLNLKLEAALNALAVREKRIEEPTQSLEQLFELFSPQAVADTLLETLRSLVGEQQTVYQGLARTPKGVRQLANKVIEVAAATIQFAGRDQPPFLTTSLTAYIARPDPANVRDERVYREFKQRICEVYSRVEELPSGRQSIELMSTQSGFVLGSTTKVQSELEAVIKLKEEHQGYLLDICDIPTLEEIEDHYTTLMGGGDHGA